MNILFLSPIHEWGFSPKVFRALKRLGHNVLWRDYRTAPVVKSIMPDADLILALRGEGLNERILKQWNCPKVNWYAEEIARPDRADEVVRLAKLFDLWAIHDKTRIDRMRELGCGRVIYARTIVCDPETQRYQEVPRPMFCGFVGSLNLRREVFLNELRRLGFEITVSEQWTEPGMTWFFNSCVLALNLHVIGHPNMETRIGEAFSCGCPVITERLSCGGEELVREGYAMEFDISDVTGCATFLGEVRRRGYMLSDFQRRGLAERMVRENNIDYVVKGLLTEAIHDETANPE